MLKTLKNSILAFTLFLFPLFFLPTTQEYFIINKFYLLAFATGLLILISALEIVLTNKLNIKLSKLDLLKIALSGSIFLSTFIISPNKVQALINPNFGLIMILALVIFTSYLQKSSLNIVRILSLSTLVLSLITIIFSFHPFENAYLPINLQFLRNHQFTPLGSQLDQAVFIFFVLTAQIIQIVLTISSAKNFSNSLPLILSSIVNLIALSLTLSGIYQNPGEPTMPLRYSWQSFVETLKNPINAIFGIGINNLPAVFTRARDVAYNHSPLWLIRSFELSGSTLLHIATESGLLGLTLTLSMFYSVIKSIGSKKNWHFILLSVLLTIMTLTPASLIIFFIFFLGLLGIEEVEVAENLGHRQRAEFFRPASRSLQRGERDAGSSAGGIKFSDGIWKITLKNAGVYIFSFLLITLMVIFAFVLARSYLAEYYFKKSADALVSQTGKILYENQRQAILINPFIERYHTSFSQTNLLLFNSLKQTTKSPELASNSAQIALVEAQIATRLNPQKATHWENLAIIARNITDVNDPVSELSFSAYEQAILLDPQNPQYRFNFGALLYQVGDFTEAIRSFEHAVALKRDWANAHYNLAWALYQNRQFDKAIKEMEAAISLLSSKTDQADLAKAKEDLATFKTQESVTSQQLNQLENRPSGQLNLPQPKPATPEIKLFQRELLNQATPEGEL